MASPSGGPTLEKTEPRPSKPPGCGSRPTARPCCREILRGRCRRGTWSWSTEGLRPSNRRDLDAFVALCDPDVEFFSRLAELEGGGPYRGHGGMRSWWQNFFGVWLNVSA